MYLQNSTGLNTEARKFVLGNTVLFFSYETLVGVIGANGKYRCAENYSRTTNRHLSEFGLTNCPRMDAEQLQRYAEVTIMTDLIDTHLPHQHEEAA